VGVCEYSSISLFPNVPDGVDYQAVEALSVVLGYLGLDLFPPRDQMGWIFGREDYARIEVFPM